MQAHAMADPDRLYWDEHVREGIEAREQRDGAQWRLGDLAASVETTYGEESLQRYAEQIGVEYATLLKYRVTARKFPVTERFTVSYSHHAEVAALDDPRPWLQMASAEAWSTARLRDEVRRTREEAERMARFTTIDSDEADAAIEQRGPDKSREGVAKRRKQIAAMTEAGYRPADIAQRVGISEGSVRNITHELGLQTVDMRIGKTRRIDVNRVVSGIVEGAVLPQTSLDLLEGGYGDLDREQLPYWIESLSESLRMLRKLRDRLRREIDIDDQDAE